MPKQIMPNIILPQFPRPCLTNARLQTRQKKRLELTLEMAGQASILSVRQLSRPFRVCFLHMLASPTLTDLADKTVSINNHSLWVYEVDGQHIVPTKVDVRSHPIISNSTQDES
jgi:hypothetical protein